jgi:hypothetical protein
MTAGFLEKPPTSVAAQALYDGDLAETGYCSLARVLRLGRDHGRDQPLHSLC